MSAWDDFVTEEHNWIAALLGGCGMDFGHVDIAPVPTRAETIVRAWETSGRQKWPEVATAYGMYFVCALGIVDTIHFEQKRYGDMIVIEAEGVIVERTPIVTVQI